MAGAVGSPRTSAKPPDSRANGGQTGQRGSEEAAERVPPHQRRGIAESDGGIGPMSDEEQAAEPERIGREPGRQSVLDDPYASDQGWIYR
jgi:hypothetical protein